MSILADLLQHKHVLLSDGARGTQLAERGLQPGESPEAWNLSRPADVSAVAAAYVDAGADIVLTNTFGGNRFKLARGSQCDVGAVNEAGAKLSKDAARSRALVFASVGPTGEFMEPLGDITEEQMIECFAEQVLALERGGADGIVIETMTDLNEAKAALKAVKEYTNLPVVVSMTFDHGPAGFATMMGVKPERAAVELEQAGADALGSNCGQGIDRMIEVARVMAPATGLPLWVKSNAGLPQLVDGKTVFRETPQEMAQKLQSLYDAGARIIGGCCGTTPEHIRLMDEARKTITGS